MSNRLLASLITMSTEHLMQTYLWLQDESLRNLIDCVKSPTQEENKQYWKARWNDPTREDYAVLDQKLQHVGNCGLSSMDKARKKSEIWIYIAMEQGKGIGSVAVSQLLDRAFNELGLERVYLRVLETNSCAINFYKKFGFVYEGCWRSDTVIGRNRVNSLFYSMLRNEFMIKNKADES